MIWFLFAVFLIATAVCIIAILSLSLNDRKDFVAFAVLLVLGAVFYISAMLIGAPQTDKQVIQCILQSATITCSLPQSNIQGEIK